MRVVLDDRCAGAVSNLLDRVHLAADAGVVDRHDDPGPPADDLGQPSLIEVQGVLADVGEDRPGTAQSEGVGGRDEGEGGHHDLVARLHVKEQSCKFQGIGAGGRQQDLGHAQEPGQGGLGALGEAAVAGDVAGIESLRHVLALPAFEAGPVEVDVVVGHGAHYPGAVAPWG